MHRSPLPWLLTLALLAAAPVPDALAEKPRRSACQKLAANYKDRSPHRKLVLVERGDSDYGSIAACVLPRGKVRRLARWEDGLGRDSAEIVRTKGYFVLVATAWRDQYGGTSRELSRTDARTGRRVQLTAYGCMIEYGQPGCPDGTNYGKVVLAASGAGAIELTDFAAGTTTLESFDVAGNFARLDDAPVDSLRIQAREIVWTRGGVERRAPLPG